MTNTVQTTDLLYAAFLLSIGAEVESIKNSGRYSTVTICTSPSILDSARSRSSRLHRICDRTETADELEYIYSHSLLNDISMHYYKLKKQIARSKNDSRGNK